MVVVVPAVVVAVVADWALDFSRQLMMMMMLVVVLTSGLQAMLVVVALALAGVWTWAVVWWLPLA